MNRRILIVEDEETIRWALRELLIEEGFEVHVAADGDQAVALIGETVHDLMITDLKMPGRSGIEVVREARRRNPRIGVIVLTGYASIETAIDAVRLRAWDYLTKPCDVTDLRARVHAFFKQADAERSAHPGRPPLGAEEIESFLEGRGTKIIADAAAATAPERAAAFLRSLKDLFADLGLDAKRAERLLQGCVEAVSGVTPGEGRWRVGLVNGHVLVGLTAGRTPGEAWRQALGRTVDTFGLDMRMVERGETPALVLSEPL